MAIAPGDLVRPQCCPDASLCHGSCAAGRWDDVTLIWHLHLHIIWHIKNNDDCLKLCFDLFWSVIGYVLFICFSIFGRIVGSAVPIVSEHLWKYDQSHVSGLYHIISCYIPTHGDLFHPPVVVYGGWPTCFGFHHVKRRLRGPRGGARRPHRQSASGAAGGRGSDGEREDSYMAGQKCWWHRE